MFILFIYPEFDHILYILYTYYIWLMSMYDCCTMYLDCHRGFDCLKCKYLQSPQNLRPTISQPLLLKNEFHPTMTHHTSKFGHFGRRWNNCDLSPATKLRIVSPHLLTKMERGYFLRWEQLVPNSKGVFPLANPLIFSWNSWGSTVWNSQFLL